MKKSIIKSNVNKRGEGIIHAVPCIAADEIGAERCAETVLRINVGLYIEVIGIAHNSPVVTEDIRENGSGGRL